eukprot:jgi/Mesen1/2231/ME000152S01329
MSCNIVKDVRNIVTRRILFRRFGTIARTFPKQRVKRLMHEAVHLNHSSMPDPMLHQLRQEYGSLDAGARRGALLALASEFGVDVARVRGLASHYLALTRAGQLDSPPSSSSAGDTWQQGTTITATESDAASDAWQQGARLRAEADLRAALTPLSGRLFEQINGQPGGLKFLVDLRQDLLKALLALDGVLKGLFATWLSPACLELRRITWADPAALLEKIVAYEAVHPVSSLSDLKRRLGAGRRCFAYVHPAMPGEPLVFIEVALAEGVSTSIQELLHDTPPAEEADATTAAGLRGIELGNFLIKRVVRLLQAEMPRVWTFATLSPVPGFLPYLLQEKKRGRALDPVANFHLVSRLNWMADTSRKGLAASAGIMVNYAYRLGDIEANHQAYTSKGSIATSDEVAGLLRESRPAAMSML